MRDSVSLEGKELIRSVYINGGKVNFYGDCIVKTQKEVEDILKQCAEIIKRSDIANKLKQQGNE